MISKICSGHSFYGSIRYVCQAHKKADILVSEGVRHYDPKLMIQDFERQHAFRPQKTQACFHGILSFYPGEKPSDQLIREIALKYLAGLGITNTQFAVVKHTDKAHLHVHLIANLVDNNGRSISDKWIGLRGKKLAQQLTTAYKLEQALNKKLAKTNLKNLRIPEQYQYKIYAAVIRYLRKSDSMDELENRLRKFGIQMEFKYKGQTQERQGVSFRLGEYCFKGSSIDRKLSYGNIMKTIQENQRLKVAQRLPAKCELLAPMKHRISQKATSHTRIADLPQLELLETLLKAEQAYMIVPPELKKQQEKKKIKPTYKLYH